MGKAPRPYTGFGQMRSGRGERRRSTAGLPREPPFLLTLARTGLRLGEAVGLEWRDVDFAQRVLVIRRSVRKRRMSLPKNGKTRRVDMSPSSLNVSTACAPCKPQKRR